MMTLTWKEFKEKMEAQGVTDDMEIDYIDFGCTCLGDGPDAYIDITYNEVSIH